MGRVHFLDVIKGNSLVQLEGVGEYRILYLGGCSILWMLLKVIYLCNSYGMVGYHICGFRIEFLPIITFYFFSSAKFRSLTSPFSIPQRPVLRVTRTAQPHPLPLVTPIETIFLKLRHLALREELVSATS